MKLHQLHYSSGHHGPNAALHVVMVNKLDHGPIVHMELKFALKSKIAILELVLDGEIGDHGVCAQELIYKSNDLEKSL